MRVKGLRVLLFVDINFNLTPLACLTISDCSYKIMRIAANFNDSKTLKFIHQKAVQTYVTKLCAFMNEKILYTHEIIVDSDNT